MQKRANTMLNFVISVKNGSELSNSLKKKGMLKILSFDLTRVTISFRPKTGKLNLRGRNNKNWGK